MKYTFLSCICYSYFGAALIIRFHVQIGILLHIDNNQFASNSGITSFSASYYWQAAFLVQLQDFGLARRAGDFFIRGDDG